MRSLNLTISACRHCQHYATEGRRGGQCNQLGAPVQGSWKACCLAIPAFAPTWEAPTEMEEVKEPWAEEMPVELPAGLPQLPTMAIASSESIGIGENPYHSPKSALRKAASPHQAVLL